MTLWTAYMQFVCINGFWPPLLLFSPTHRLLAMIALHCCICVEKFRGFSSRYVRLPPMRFPIISAHRSFLEPLCAIVPIPRKDCPVARLQYSLPSALSPLF